MKPKHIALALVAGAYLALGIGMVGCATVRPTPSAALSATQEAGKATSRAVESTVSAKAAVARARAEINEQNIPAAQAALDDATAMLDETQQQLAVATDATERAMQQIDQISRALHTAETEVEKLKAGRGFWRATAWKLALLALALGVWTFRRPLLALCGLPTI